MNDNTPIRGPWKNNDFRLIIGRTRIDYDWMKEESNRRKHGYSLESAVHFLEGMLLPLGKSPVATRGPIECTGELRHQHMTLDAEQRVVFFVTTMRHNETVRVISLRVASPEEAAVYKSLCGHTIVPKKQEGGTDAGIGS